MCERACCLSCSLTGLLEGTSITEMCILLICAFRLPSFLNTQLQSMHGNRGTPLVWQRAQAHTDYYQLQSIRLYQQLLYISGIQVWLHCLHICHYITLQGCRNGYILIKVENELWYGATSTPDIYGKWWMCRKPIQTTTDGFYMRNIPLMMENTHVSVLTQTAVRSWESSSSTDVVLWKPNGCI